MTRRYIAETRRRYRDRLRERKICIICFSRPVRPGINERLGRPYASCDECIARVCAYYADGRRKSRSVRRDRAPAGGRVARVWYDCCLSANEHRRGCAEART